MHYFCEYKTQTALTINGEPINGRSRNENSGEALGQPLFAKAVNGHKIAQSLLLQF
jgi:hypothetical protein